MWLNQKNLQKLCNSKLRNIIQDHSVSQSDNDVIDSCGYFWMEVEEIKLLFNIMFFKLTHPSSQQFIKKCSLTALSDKNYKWQSSNDEWVVTSQLFPCGLSLHISPSTKTQSDAKVNEKMSFEPFYGALDEVSTIEMGAKMNFDVETDSNCTLQISVWLNDRYRSYFDGFVDNESNPFPLSSHTIACLVYRYASTQDREIGIITAINGSPLFSSVAINPTNPYYFQVDNLLSGLYSIHVLAVPLKQKAVSDVASYAWVKIDGKSHDE